MKKLANRVSETSDSGLDDLFIASSAKHLVSFAGGYPDASLFPNKDMQTAFNHTFEKNQTDLLQYGDTLGNIDLRKQLVTRLNADGLSITTNQLMLIQGAQQGLDLTAKLLLDVGDGIAVEAPTYIGAISAFNAYEPTYYEIPMDEDGMNMIALKKALLSHPIKFIYTIPDFQNPTGVVMSATKRQQLINLANQFNVIILEDSPYRDLRYSGENLPSIKSLDTEGRVIYLGSFSKILAPALRLGWLVADGDLFKHLTELREGVDLQSSNLTIEGVASYMREFNIDEHIQLITKTYATKKDAMLAALDKYMPTEVSYTRPNGGFFIWLTVPESMNMTKILKANAIPDAEVAYVPSEHLFAASHRTNGARLSFTGASLADIDSGIKKLATIIKASITTNQKISANE